MRMIRVTDTKTAYACLALAICCEVIGTAAMKASAGFRLPGYAGIMFVAYVLSFSLMTLALEVLDLGVAYATWSGVGTTATAIVAVWKFNEKMTWIKAFAVVCVILSVTFLQLVSPSGAESKPEDNVHNPEAQPLLDQELENGAVSNN